MKKILTIILFTISIICNAQIRVGYIGGLTKISLDGPASLQPCYGFNLSLETNKAYNEANNLPKYFYAKIESDLIYIQAQKNNKVQSDYMAFTSFAGMGYRKNKIAIYVTEGLSWNACLYHSNPANHTYQSAIAAAGIQFQITDKINFDIKTGYNFAISAGYLDQYNAPDGTHQDWQDYNGFVSIWNLNFKLK